MRYLMRTTSNVMLCLWLQELGELNIEKLRRELEEELAAMGPREKDDVEQVEDFVVFERENRNKSLSQEYQEHQEQGTLHHR